MYIVICETSYEVWYNEFNSLQSALDYIKGYDGRVIAKIFKAEELELLRLRR